MTMKIDWEMRLRGVVILRSTIYHASGFIDRPLAIDVTL